MTRSAKIGLAAVVAIAIAAFVAFGVFGIHTAFIDDEVSEDNPFADLVVDTASESEAATELAPVESVTGDAPTSDTDEPDVEPADAATDGAAVADADTSLQADEAEATEAVESEEVAESEEPAAPAESAEPQVRTVASNNGAFVEHSRYSGSGTANVITDGNRTFLRFEDDFEVSNGPDLNVYLVRGVDAAGPTGEFDDDFIDLGDLKGNIGSQNYELPQDLDVSEYDTVVIWCVRFGVAFTSADLV